MARNCDTKCDPNAKFVNAILEKVQSNSQNEHGLPNDEHTVHGGLPHPSLVAHLPGALTAQLFD
jgi:hypothetical protein